MRNGSRLTFAGALVILACGPALAAETTRISLTSDGGQANGESVPSSVSFDGRYVVFSSVATNLVSGDANDASDVFLRDNDTKETVRISRGRNGAEANGASSRAVISADGRFVAFASAATNLVQGDGNGKTDIFVFDRRTETTERVSVASEGGEANGTSDAPSISADGQRIAFQSYATNLFPDDANNARDVLLRDRAAGTTTLVSKNSDGEPGDGSSAFSAISADGRFVAFWTTSSNIGKHRHSFGGSNIVRHDSVERTTVCVTTLLGSCQDTLAFLPSSAINADGRYVVFQDFIDGNTGTSEPLVVGNIVRDMETGDQTIVSRPPSGDFATYDSYAPAISADGRFVAFASGASNLVKGDTNKKLDVFVTDRLTGAVTRASLGGKSRQATANSAFTAISGDARFVTFSSEAAELVDDDTNAILDVFMRDLDAEPGKRADMRVEAATAPRKVKRGERTKFSFVATNAGPDAATKASFVLQVESGRVRDASGADCGASSGLVTCDLGKLAPRKSVTIKLEVVADGDTLRQSARVQAAPLDPAKIDNSLTVTSKVN